MISNQCEYCFKTKLVTNLTFLGNTFGLLTEREVKMVVYWPRPCL